MMAEQSRITAVLGPTNTGKTHYAIERMLGYRTGIIGLPLRLLAREVYDKIVALRGPSIVALVTGEERIVPPRTQYWVCTVEAMPDGIGADFVAVDEIQLCADPERGHVFTDRLLHMRGQLETLFLGSDTMKGAISQLVPKAQYVHRERFSQLTHSGEKKISRMPATLRHRRILGRECLCDCRAFAPPEGWRGGGDGRAFPPYPQCAGRDVSERRCRLPCRHGCHRHGVEP